MAKSVDKIVKGLEKMVIQLGICIDSCITEMATQGSVITEAKAKWKFSDEERERDRRIQDKITELIK